MNNINRKILSKCSASIVTAKGQLETLSEAIELPNLDDLDEAVESIDTIA